MKEKKKNKEVWEKRVSSVGTHKEQQQDSPTPDGSVAMRLR